MKRLLPRLCALPLLLLLWAPGCSEQGEGERCDLEKNGNQDCETGLVCVSAADLIDNATDRCCPPAGQKISDNHCLRNDGSGGTGGAAGCGGAAGGGGSAGTDGSAGGTGGASGGTGGTGGSSGKDSGNDAAPDAADGSSGDSGGD